MESDEALRLLPVLPWTLAALSVVLVVALAVPPGGPRPADVLAGPSPVARRRAALPAAALLVAAVLGCRLGSPSELDNPVPAVVVGLGLPALLLLPPLCGLLLGGLLSRRRAAVRGTQDVRPAVPVALALVAALVLPATPTRPEAVGTGLLAYGLLLGLAVLALGLGAAAARVEVLGLLARWSALGPRLVRWQAPRGALAVLAVLLGGTWAERYERSAAWFERLAGTGEVAAGLAAALVLAAAGAALLERAAAGSAAAVLLPLAVATALAGSLRRGLISAQLLAGGAVDPDPLGVVGGQVLALAVVVLGGALSAAVLARRLGEGAARLPATGVLLLLVAVSALVVLQR